MSRNRLGFVVALLAVPILFGACLQLGSYDGAGNVSGAKSFDQETGTTSTVYSDYLDGTSFTSECSNTQPFPLPNIKGQLGSEQLELSVPLPGFHLGQNGQALLAQYAAPGGLPYWNVCMQNIANGLVADGFANAIIRPMWEPDSGIYSNEDLTSAHNYATLFAATHDDMMAVSGAAFSFDWYWGANFDNTTNTTAYPGSQYVTDVTFDQYDQSWYGGCGLAFDGSSWNATQSQCIWDNDISHNLANLLSFAGNAGKPVSIGEWGVINRSDGHGGGDDPTYVNNFAAWLKANATWESYFNFNSGGDSILSDFPNSLQAFKADL